MTDISDWNTIDVLDSGIPKLRPGEVVLVSSPMIGLYSNDLMVPMWQSCVVSLTPHRIILCDPLARAGIMLPLHKVQRASEKAGFGNWSHPKIRLHMQGDVARFYMVSFRSGGLEAFLAKLRPCIIETPPPCAAGIAGVANAVSARQQASMDVVKNAFTDLGSLKQCMQDVLDVARKLQREAGSSSPAEELKLRQTFQSLGVVDPVTRAAAGSVVDYHSQLGAELTAWLLGVLPTIHGVMTIHDMYALYNRARGKDLVGPSDLLRACEAPHLGGGILLRRMAGTYLVLSAEWKASYDALLGTLSLAPTLSINDVGLSRRMNISVSLARDLLLGSEAECCLCRCETRSGIEFYQNMFLNPPR